MAILPTKQIGVDQLRTMYEAMPVGEPEYLAGIREDGAPIRVSIPEPEPAETTFNILDYGADPTGATDSRAAIQEALDDARAAVATSGVRTAAIYVPRGTYRCTAGLTSYCYGSTGHPQPISIYGDGADVSIIEAAFEGAGNVLFEITAPSMANRGDTANRSEGHAFRDLMFRSRTNLSQGPVLFRQRSASLLTMDRVTFYQYRENAAVQISDPFNCDLRGLTIWGGGHQKAWRTAGTQGSYAITATQGSAVITSSSPGVFQNSDVGRVVTIYNGSANGDVRFVTTVASYTSATQVALADAAPVGGANCYIFFDTVLGSGSAAGNTVTVDAPVMSAADIGRAVVIRGKVSTRVLGAGSCLHAFITGVSSSTQFTISETIDLAFSGCHVYFSPALDIWNERTASTSLNDITIDVRMPPFSGLGAYIGYGSNVWFRGTKLHALNPITAGATIARYAHLGLLWEANNGGVSDLAMDGSVMGRHKIVASCIRSVAHFNDLAGQVLDNQKFLHLENAGNGGRVKVTGVAVAACAQATLNAFFSQDGSDGRINLYGPIAAATVATPATISAPPAWFPGGVNSDGGSTLDMPDDTSKALLLPYRVGPTKSGAIMLFGHNVPTHLAIIAYSYGAITGIYMHVGDTDDWAVVEGVFTAVGDYADGKITVVLDENGNCTVVNRRGGNTNLRIVHFA